MSQQPNPTPLASRTRPNGHKPPPAKLTARYLSDPNFYRLHYQLAAQSLNDALLRRNDTPPSETPHPAEPSESPPHAESEDRVAQLERESRELAEEAARVAKELAGSKARNNIKVALSHAEDLDAIVSATIKRLHNVTREKTKWRRFRTLTAQQLRLKRFLEETVQPCGELVVAGARAALGDPDRDKRLASRIRDSVLKGNLSYRVAYNLACYELAFLDKDTAEESWALALDALRVAFRDAPNQRQRTALVAWARKDPALKPISEFPDFEKLLQRNQIEQLSRESLTEPD